MELFLENICHKAVRSPAKICAGKLRPCMVQVECQPGKQGFSCPAVLDLLEVGSQSRGTPGDTGRHGGHQATAATYQSMS